jgi:hypothetical protein
MYFNSFNSQIVSEQEIRQSFPDVSFPAVFVPPEGYFYIFPTSIPSYDADTQYIRQLAPELTNLGHYEQRFEVVDLAPEIIADRLNAKMALFQNQVVDAIQLRLDNFARTRNYMNILSACSYVNSSVPRFAADAAYCVSARDNTWDTLHTLLAEVQAETRVIPETVQGVLDILPTLAWPV